MLPISAKERHRDRVLASRLISLALVLFVGGCAVAPPPPPPGAEPVTVSPISVIGTPFLLALKAPICAVTLAIGGPVAAAQQLAEPTRDEFDKDFRPEIATGIETNCGPPYVVMPY